MEEKPKKPTKIKNSTDKQRKINGNLKSWKKGQSGNPKGRPKKGSSWSEIAPDLLDSSEIMIQFKTSKKTQSLHIKTDDDKTIRHAVVAALINEALHGNIQAIKELYDRTDGRAPQKIEIEEAILPTGFDIGLIPN